MLVADADRIELAEGAGRHVSRGALKRAAALDAYSLSPMDRIALDIGASIGGFAQLLLERGAQRVYTVDVGQGQLHARLRDVRRVVVLERRDARALTAADIPEPVSAVTADLRFISLTLVPPHVLTFAMPGAWLVALAKPQFEARREAVRVGGIVRNAAGRARAAVRVRGRIAGQPGWSVTGEMVSPITGQDGNEEWLLAAQKAV